jgi:anti-sigma regulatory factor (Ser/Thr protein kinase)/predicted transcriptional regulator
VVRPKDRTKSRDKKAKVAGLILKLAKRSSGVKSSDLIKVLGLSRQMVARYLSGLTEIGELRKEGSTRSARYFIAQKGAPSALKELRFTKKRKGLEEDVVFQELSLRANLARLCSPNALAVFKYAFTEMLNNAIDHSDSEKVEIRFEAKQKDIAFEIRDFGIGIYKRVQDYFELENHFQAVEHLLKGKQTTDASKHTGQGIFFTSRAADVFAIKSAAVELVIDNQRADHFLKDVNHLKGTLVRFQISRQTRKELRKIFDQFSNADFEFDRNSVRVKVSTDENLVSRSEAKRLLVGLDRFSRIEFDFKGVETIGQGFSDEIFRVFQKSHPNIVLSYTHAGSAVAFMIERSRKS